MCILDCRDNENSPLECGHLSSSPRSMLSGQNNSTFGTSVNDSNSSVGGPLISGNINGQVSSAVSASGRTGGVSSSGFGTSVSATNDVNNTVTLNSSSAYHTFTMNDFDELFPTSTWDMAGASENSLDRSGPSQTSTWEQQPDSRQSLTPVSTPTPRPPSGPGYSPSSGICSSPLNPYSQPSPATNQVSTPSNPYANSFPFSPLQEQGPNSGFSLEESKDSKDTVAEHVNTGNLNGGDNSTSGDSGRRLRNLLLTTKRPSMSADDVNESADHTGQEGVEKHKHHILKGLLDQVDEDEGRIDDSSSGNRGLVGGRLFSDAPKVSSQASSSNNMLLKVSRFFCFVCVIYYKLFFFNFIIHYFCIYNKYQS